MEVCPALVSAVTNVVTDEITEWQNRPLDAFYAIVYIDALVVKVRDGGAVDKKGAYLVTGVDADGYKHVLGIWLCTAQDLCSWQTYSPSSATASSSTSCSSAATLSTACISDSTSLRYF